MPLQEPFLDAAQCDTAARTILLRAQLELLRTLRRRGLPAEEAAVAISDLGGLTNSGCSSEQTGGNSEPTGR